MDTKAVTVAGKTFNMPLIFAEGQEVTLTEGQASQFNQVFHENIRNNFAKKVKDAEEKGSFDLAAFQAQIDAYANEYEFGTRKSSGPRTPSDPVAKEALKIATDAVHNHIKTAMGKKPSDFKAESIKTLAQKLLESRPDITEKAKAIVAERQIGADQSLADIMGGLEVKPPAEVAQAAE